MKRVTAQRIAGGAGVVAVGTVIAAGAATSGSDHNPLPSYPLHVSARTAGVDGAGARLNLVASNNGRLTAKNVSVQILEERPGGTGYRAVTPIIEHTDGDVANTPVVTKDGKIDFGSIPSGWIPEVTVRVPRLGDQRARYALGGVIKVYENGKQVTFKSKFKPGVGFNAVRREGWGDISR